MRRRRRFEKRWQPLQLDNIRLDDQCRFAVSRGGPTREFLNRVSEDNRGLRQNICNSSAQHDMKLADLLL